jgi:hypothetical protein
MNQQVKEKWITALRSGEYTQAREFLRTDYGYCCLGVLTDLYLKEVNEQWVPFGNHTTIPILVAIWADISQNSEDVLIQMNDTEGRTFNEIADYIQENL